MHHARTRVRRRLPALPGCGLARRGPERPAAARVRHSPDSRDSVSSAPVAPVRFFWIRTFGVTPRSVRGVKRRPPVVRYRSTPKAAVSSRWLLWRRSGSARRLLPGASACPAAASTAPPRSCARYQQIRRLGAQFGVTLLERNSRNVRLTDAGDGISYEGCEAARSGRERCCRQSG